MFIDPEIVEKHSFEVQNKETNKIYKAIYDEHVPSVLSDESACYAWVQSDKHWFWWNEKNFKEKLTIINPEETMTKKERYTTRYVIDIDWENVDGLYGGENGASDCGTVMALDSLLNKAIKDGTLRIDDVKAVQAQWISYVTNVSHKPLGGQILNGKALHPKLRETKGYWNKKQKPKDDWEKNVVICKNENGIETAFLLGEHAPPGNMETWYETHNPYPLSHSIEGRIWHFEDDWVWRHTSKNLLEDDGWDLSPLYVKDTNEPYHKDQVFYDPELIPCELPEVKFKAEALGYKWIVSHLSDYDEADLIIFNIKDNQPCDKHYGVLEG